MKIAYLKKITSPAGEIIAACDKELLGKRFEQGKLMLDLKKNAGFYKGELHTKKEVKEKIKGAHSINLIGEKTVGIAVEEGIIEAKNIKRIAGIPHVQIYRIK